MLKLIRSQKGFTLIELLVVLGILAAIAGVVTLAVGQFIGEGVCQACQVDRHNVQTAVVAFMAQNNGAAPASGDFASLDEYLLDDSDYAWTWDGGAGGTGEITNFCSDVVGAQCASP